MGMEKSTQRKRRKWPIAAGVMAAIIAVGGIGFAVWHEQPSFCNAICHEPMDAYAEGYFEDASLLAYQHRAANVTCLQCHDASLEEQIAEGISWMRGDYEMAGDGTLATVGVTADMKQCTREGCHDFAEVVASTADWGGDPGVNPHESHQGIGIDCSNCHGVHEQSYMFCNTCHDYSLPEGWANPQ